MTRGWLAAPCGGKETAQRTPQQWMADESHWTIVTSATRISGNQVTPTLDLRSQSIRAAAGPFRTTTARSVNAAVDRLKVRFALDAAGPRTAAFIAQAGADRQPLATTPVQLPRAGTGGLQSEDMFRSPDPDLRSVE